MPKKTRVIFDKDGTALFPEDIRDIAKSNTHVFAFGDKHIWRSTGNGKWIVVGELYKPLAIVQ